VRDQSTMEKLNLAWKHIEKIWSQHRQAGATCKAAKAAAEESDPEIREKDDEKQRWRSHHSIRHNRKLTLHANCRFQSYV